jgi:hypothetical protein
VSVRLKIDDSSEGLVATISERDDTGKVIGTPSVLLVRSKEGAKQQARSLGLKVYGIVDTTGTGTSCDPRLSQALASLYEPLNQGSKLRPIS